MPQLEHYFRAGTFMYAHRMRGSLRRVRKNLDDAQRGSESLTIWRYFPSGGCPVTKLVELVRSLASGSTSLKRADWHYASLPPNSQTSTRRPGLQAWLSTALNVGCQKELDYEHSSRVQTLSRLRTKGD